MVALLYLKHAFNESDGDVIQRWGETPTWQYFSGNEYFEHQWPRAPIDSVKHHGPQSTAPTSWVSLSFALDQAPAVPGQTSGRRP